MTTNDFRELTVRKGNPLIQKSRYDLTARQYDLLTFCISLVKPTDKQNTRYNFEIMDFCRVVGLEARSGKNVRDIKKDLDNIDRMTIWVYDKETQTSTRTRWFNTLKIHEGDGTITFSFHESVGEWVFLQASNYTDYIAENSYSLSSRYAKYLYDFLHSVMNMGSITISIEQFTDICPNPYKGEYKRINERILQQAAKEINSLTDITFTYEPISKQGRKTTHIRFKINKVSGFEEEIIRKVNRTIAIDGYPEEETGDEMPF